MKPITLLRVLEYNMQRAKKEFLRSCTVVRRLKELYRRASNELRQRHVAAVALENKATDIRKRQKRRKELKPQLTDLFSARRGVPPELVQNILTFVGYDLVQADAPGYDLMRDDPREVDPSALKK